LRRDGKLQVPKNWLHPSSILLGSEAGGVLVGLAFGAGGDDEGFFDFGHGRPADFFDGVTKAGFAEAAIVELADAEAGGRDRRRQAWGARLGARGEFLDGLAVGSWRVVGRRIGSGGVVGTGCRHPGGMGGLTWTGLGLIPGPGQAAAPGCAGERHRVEVAPGCLAK